MGTVVVGGVIEKNGKFLLVQEAKEKCRGKWNIPAGHLDPNESIFDGAKREVKEETGCDVELTGVLQIGNRVLKEIIEYDKNEILDVKWFTYEELLNMKEELRDYNWIINSISALIENKVANIDLVKMM